MRKFSLLCLIAATFSLTCPVLAQQISPIASKKFHQETSNKKLLRGITTVVLVVKHSGTYQNGKVIKNDNDPELVMNVDTLRKNIETKLNAIGVKTITEAERTRLAQSNATSEQPSLASIPTFTVLVHNSKTAGDKTPLLWWSGSMDMQQSFVPYSQLLEGVAEHKAVEVYTISSWHTEAGASLMPNESFDHSIQRECGEAIARFIKDWRVANGKAVFDSFPRH